jgi:tetratricopeptide (TPR) repeat protein
MQEGTESVRAPSTYANNWEEELKIDIPNTGATTDQVWKVLRGWLGKETRISGEVIDLGSGLALTVRVGAKPGQRFVSGDSDLDLLVGQGAELIFKRTQPYRHAVYLGRTPDRENERYALLMALTADPSDVERKWAYSGLAYDRREMGFFADAARMGRNALAIDPDMTPARGNLAVAEQMMGHDEQALNAYVAELRSKASDQYDPRIAAANRCGSLSSIGELTRDPGHYEQGITCLQRAPGSYSQFIDGQRASLALMRRDPGPALAYRASPKIGLSPEEVAASAAEYRLSGEMVRGPSPALAQALDAYRVAAAAREAKRAYFRNSAPALSWPLQAEALVILGRGGEAAALAARTPRDCYNCVRVRGLAAQATGNAPAAQLWFAEAVRQGPRLPAAYVDWARLLAAHRRWASAEKRFAKAAELAPNWADPLKYWGDALVAQGRRPEAAAKYDAAIKLAPKWEELKRARAQLVGRV